MTLKQLAADARTISGEMNFTDPNDTEVLRFAEEALQKIGKMLQGVDPRVYGEVSVFGGSGTGLGSFGSGTYNPTTRKITQTGAFASVPYGGLVVAYGILSGVEVWGAAVCVAKTDDTLTLDRDVLGMIPTTLNFFYYYDSSTSGTLSLSSNPISEVILGWSSVLGMMVPCEVDKFLTLSLNPNFDGSIAYYQRGQTLEYRIGSLLPGLGLVIVFFKRKPKSLTSMADPVDLPVKYHGLLRDEIANILITRRGKVPPPELQNPLAPLVAQMNMTSKSLELASQKVG